MNPDTKVIFDDPAKFREAFMQNVHSQQPISSDENVVFNYRCGSKIRNITKGTIAITNGYGGSLFTSETLVKMGTAPSFQAGLRQRDDNARH